MHMADYGYNLCTDDDAWSVVLLRWYGGGEECYLDDAPIVYRHGTDLGAMGGRWLLVVFWR